MKIKVIGYDDPKFKISIERLIKAFSIEHQLVDADEDLAFAYQSYCTETATMTDGNNVYQHSLRPEDLPELKYTLLGVLYKALTASFHQQLEWGLLTGIRPTKLVRQLIDEGLSEVEVEAILINKYFLSLEKAKELIEIVKIQKQVVPEIKPENSLSVYINIPYCLSRCSYCSFTAYSKAQAIIKPNQYLEALMAEIDQFKNFIKTEGYQITTIYIGGGTPSALDETELSKLLQAVENLIAGQNVLEYTFEAGRPDSLTEAKLRLIKQASVTRISINPQTFNENTLKRVNRNHSVQAIYDVYDLARRLGFDNINMDLIIGLPGESNDDLIHSIDAVINLKPESVTIHSLALKSKSDYGLNKAFNVLVGNYEQGFLYAQKQLKSAGYQPYYLYRQKNIINNLENIGYSLADKASLYNILMIDEAQTIIGLGCGASSKFLDYDLILNPRDLKTYCEQYPNYLEKKLKKLISMH